MPGADRARRARLFEPVLAAFTEGFGTRDLIGGGAPRGCAPRLTRKDEMATAKVRAGSRSTGASSGWREHEHIFAKLGVPREALVGLEASILGRVRHARGAGL